MLIASANLIELKWKLIKCTPDPLSPAKELCLQPSSLKPPLCRLTSRAKPTRLVGGKRRRTVGKFEQNQNQNEPKTPLEFTTQLECQLN